MTNSKPKLNPAEVMASLRDVTVTYDGYQTRALNHLDLEIRRGEVTAVLGIKAAGKSTLLKLLAGIMSPTEGSVKVLGRSARASKARVGYLAGKVDLDRPPGFVDGLLGRKRKPLPTARGLARVAQAMLGNSDLLVLDDPFADLSAAELIEGEALIRDMVARGKTVILGTDSLAEVKSLCTRLVILHEGKIQASGSIEELLSSVTALRFLPAFLPSDSAARLLEALRKEIQSISENTSPAHPEKSSLADHQRPSASDSIDHEKLEGLTKPKPAH